MLVQFSVSNFLSFRERATLSLLASADSTLESNVMRSAGGGKADLLKSAAILGPNASGKSNFIKAMLSMRARVLGESGAVPLSGPERFRLDRQSRERPSEFEAVILIDGVRFAYGFATDAAGVRAEWLYSYASARPRLLFDRSVRSGAAPKMRKGRGWKFADSAAGAEGLILTRAAAGGNPEARRIRDWFSRCRMMVPGPEADTAADREVLDRIGRSKNFRRRLVRFLRSLDLEIEDLRPGADGIEVLHRGRDGDGGEYEVAFGLEAESDGTRRLIRLGSAFVSALQEGAPVILDEMDARLHPLLMAPIVRMFHDATINRRGAQLVFSTHSCHALDTNLLRRDQIWFVERDAGTGASRLISLWDFAQADPEEVLEKGYLAGRYGAIPMLGGPGEL